ncbi:MAG: adenylate/guanylate cyclase domain-containing protein [Mariprofundaceae bacterium]|nr:adenylate/guanylate cyclase domain-containing protein [Mariprofundaceae bacterium]
MSKVEGKTSRRLQIRWRWTFMVEFAVIMTVASLMMIILNVERDAWLNNQEKQAKVSVNRLAEALKLPLLSGSEAEVGAIIHSFMETEKAVLAVSVHFAHSKQGKIFGDEGGDRMLLNHQAYTATVLRLKSENLWFAKRIQYANTSIGDVAVRYSQTAWALLSQRILHQMLLAAIVVVLLSSLLIYWIAGQISKPMEALADAASRVAGGDYQVQLTVKGNDEVSDAMSQFNQMVMELAHKEKMRDTFGKYLNPKLVSEVFEHGSAKMDNHRQVVTVIFADMVGFTSFSESATPEYVVDVLNKHFEVFHRIIDYFTGNVDKYIGDAVMAVFNHPKENEHHVEYAVLAALAMAKACEHLGVLRQNGEKISFRVGLNCGDAIVGSIGANERLEYTVIGDTVNIASRMCGLGEGGEVILSHATFEALDERFGFETLGMKKVKGVTDLLECGRVVVQDQAVQEKIDAAVGLAFDLTLPVALRAQIGEVT